MFSVLCKYPKLIRCLPQVCTIYALCSHSGSILPAPLYCDTKLYADNSLGALLRWDYRYEVRKYLVKSHKMDSLCAPVRNSGGHIIRLHDFKNISN